MEDGYGLVKIATFPVLHRYIRKQLFHEATREPGRTRWMGAVVLAANPPFRLEQIPTRPDCRWPTRHLLFARPAGGRVRRAFLWALAYAKGGPGGVEDEAAEGAPARAGAGSGLGSHESDDASDQEIASRAVAARRAIIAVADDIALGPTFRRGFGLRVLDAIQPERITGVDQIDDGIEDLTTPVAPFAQLRAVFVTGNREHHSGTEPWVLYVPDLQSAVHGERPHRAVSGKPAGPCTAPWVWCESWRSNLRRTAPWGSFCLATSRSQGRDLTFRHRVVRHQGAGPGAAGPGAGAVRDPGHGTGLRECLGSARGSWRHWSYSKRRTPTSALRMLGGADLPRPRPAGRRLRGQSGAVRSGPRRDGPVAPEGDLRTTAVLPCQ